MKTNRRKFITQTTLAAGAILTAGNLAFAADGGELNASRDLLARQTAAGFERLVGQSFWLSADGANTTIAVLSRVKSLGDKDGAPRGRRELLRAEKTAHSFALSFTLPDAALPQATYDVWNAQLGSFKLFLVPGADAAGEFLLHADFNRI